MFRLRIAGTLLLVGAAICLLGAGIIDLSTPEATMGTYYSGYISGQKDIVAQTFLSSPQLEDTGFSPPIIRGFRIVDVRTVTRPQRFGQPGDVEVTTEVFWRTEQPSEKFRFVLRRIDQNWKIVSYSAMRGEQ